MNISNKKRYINDFNDAENYYTFVYLYKVEIVNNYENNGKLRIGDDVAVSTYKRETKRRMIQGYHADKSKNMGARIKYLG